MNQDTPTAAIARRIVEILEEHKGEDILFLDVSEQVDFTDYFIIVSATSDRMIQALADAVQDKIRDEFKLHSKLQGISGGGWTLIDLGDIVVHIFSPERREFYDLESLWKEAKTLLRIQ